MQLGDDDYFDEMVGLGLISSIFLFALVRCGNNLKLIRIEGSRRKDEVLIAGPVN